MAIAAVVILFLLFILFALVAVYANRVQKVGPNEVLVISFWHQVIAQIPDDASLRRGVLFSHRPNDPAGVLATIPRGVHTAVWNYEFIDEELLRQAAGSGFKSLVYGPQSPAEHAHCLTVGLSGVITDHPEYLLPPDRRRPPSKSSGD